MLKFVLHHVCVNIPAYIAIFPSKAVINVNPVINSPDYTQSQFQCDVGRGKNESSMALTK